MYESFEKRVVELRDYVTGTHEVTLFEITSLFGHDGYFLISLFLTVPFLQPIPLFGFSTVIGTILAFFSAFIIANQSLYIPNCLKQWTVPSKTVITWTGYFLLFCKKTEKWLHPRAGFIQKNVFMRMTTGLIIFVSSILLALPLPFPFTNTLPALSISIISIGSLREDTVAVFCGIFCFICSLIYLGVLLMIPFKIAEQIS